MQAATPDFDIAICGAGPVGLALAAMLVRQGMAPERILLSDARPVERAMDDPRSIALSFGSRQLLEDIGAWPALSTPIREIHVSRRGRFGRTLITADEQGIPELGYVARYGVLVASLDRALALHPFAFRRPAQIESIHEKEDRVELRFGDGQQTSAAIAVQAEGGVFGEQAERQLNRNYGQAALVCQVRAAMPIAARAFERFTDEGPLALLPQDDGFALVWCVRPATAEHLLALDDARFLSELQLAFGSRLGRFTSASPRVSFPLGLNAHPVGSARTVAVGNAAQTLHPVAGQGLNLGLRDAAILARLLAQDTDPAMLERFRMARRPDRSLTIRLTDTMARIFASAPAGSVTQSLLGASLAAIDVVHPVKRLLADQMMYGRR